MSGGVAYIYDAEDSFARKCNMEMVELVKVESDDDSKFLKDLLKDSE